MAINNTGEARGHGAIRVRDGGSTLMLVADGSAQASCADSDGEGGAGLARMMIGLRDVRTGERLTAVVTPAGGDMDESGKYKISILVGRAKAEGIALIVFPGR